jgi:hypothetical protein
MKTTTFLMQAERVARFVDALLVARDALVTHDGLTILADAEKLSRWSINLSAALRVTDAVLQMAGTDTTQPLHLPIAHPHDEDDDPQQSGE